MNSLLKFAMYFIFLFSSVNALAQAQCASNTNGRTATCKGTQGTCYAWPGSSQLPYANPFTAGVHQECCYNTEVQSCGAGAALAPGVYVPIVCPDQNPYQTNGGPWTVCGMSCVPTIPGCNEDYCKDIGYNYMCPLTKACTNDLSFCPENASEANCASQGKVKCGNSCIDPNRNICIENKVCGKDDDALCNGTCIDTATEKCMENSKVCKLSDDALCGGNCIDFEKNKCISAKVCELKDDTLCNGNCMDNATENCVNDRYPCEKKYNDLCGSSLRPACFDNAVQNCVEGNHLCDKPMDAWDTCAKCYKKDSLPLGESCFKDVQCSVGKCNGFSDPFCKKGTCVCKEDADCGNNEYCDKGVILGIGKNSCKPKKVNGISCGQDKQCVSGRCNLGKCKECKKDNQCARGESCDNGVCKK